MDQYDEPNAKMNAYFSQQAINQSYQGGAAGLGGSALGQIGKPVETLQMLSNENASKCARANQQLAVLRSKLFGEAESPKDKDPGNQPTMSLGGSISRVNDELLEIFRQLDSLVARV